MLDDQDTRTERVLALFHEVRVEQECVQAFDEAAADLLGIHLTDLRCLGILERMGPISPGELGTESGLTTGSVTALLDRLERAGYVHRVRSEVDRRRISVELTEEAREGIKRIWGPFGAEAWAMASRYTDEQIELITEYLRGSRAMLDRHLRRLRASAADGGGG